MKEGSELSMWWNYGFWGFPFFPLLWILFWIFVISFFFRGWGHRHYWRGHSDYPNDKTPEEILKERFAKGDIERKNTKNG